MYRMRPATPFVACVACLAVLIASTQSAQTLDATSAVSWLMHCLQQDGAARTLAPNPACQAPITQLLRVVGSAIANNTVDEVWVAHARC